MARRPTLVATATAVLLVLLNPVARSQGSDLEKIRDEGMNRSQVMTHLGYLTDVIGARLTNSPSMKRANEWTRDTMATWGMQNAALEAWGPFGRGWSLGRFSAQLVGPVATPVVAYPKAWSPSTAGPVTAEVVYVDGESDAELEKYRGTLRGKIIFMSKTRELRADFDGMGDRLTDEQLTRMANAPDPATVPPRPLIAADGKPTPEMMAMLREAGRDLRILRLALAEGASLVVDNSKRGSGGTVMVSPATVVPPPKQGALPWLRASEPYIVPQMTMATEDYNRIVRLIQRGITPTMSVEIQAQYHDDDLMGYNTVAEIPGTDPLLRDEIVMLGGHLDSWHGATGATDNAAGSAVAMEAARIIMASGLRPRRTIRVGLWSGEEMGLLGSKAYVAAHFGSVVNDATAPADASGLKRRITKGPDYDKLSVYYNLDNGTGKIRGVYLQGNAAVKPLFEAWLKPFADLGAHTLTLSNTSGTDHLAFDQIGLPGFQFIQDQIEYETRTHHTSQDNFDRIQAEDLKQAATIMAAFVYQSAMMEAKMPRKPAGAPVK